MHTSNTKPLLNLTTASIAVVIVATVAIVLAMQGSAWFGPLKTGTTLLILAFWFVFARDLDRGNYITGAVGFAFCAAGDTALLYEQGFVYGLSFFLVAHGLFIVIFRRMANSPLSVPAFIAVFAISCGYYLILFSNLVHLAIPVALYMGVISVMAAWAVTIWLKQHTTATLLIMLGALSFLVSDSVLAYNRFVSAHTWLHVVVLSTYWLSLLLIANGAARYRTINQHQ